MPEFQGLSQQTIAPTAGIRSTLRNTAGLLGGVLIGNAVGAVLWPDVHYAAAVCALCVITVAWPSLHQLLVADGDEFADPDAADCSDCLDYSHAPDGGATQQKHCALKPRFIISGQVGK
jgi:hypothetical protein